MPILDANTFEFFSRSAEQTRRVGMRLGAALEAGDVVCLEGELGSGKTTLVQGIAAGWGSSDAASSPTYVLVNVYRRADGERLAHLDAYRMESTVEAQALGLDELLDEGPLLVEWAPRILPALPEEHLWIKLGWVADEHRRLQFSAQGERYADILSHFQQAMIGTN